MGEHNNGPYEQQLRAVFESCLIKGQTELREDDLYSLCKKLQLDDHGEELKGCIQKYVSGKQSISFQEFRDGLLLLLDKTQGTFIPNDKECIEEQEVNTNNSKSKTDELLDSENTFHQRDYSSRTDQNNFKGLWEKVNTCLKESTDTSDICYMSNYKGISTLPRQVAQRIFEKLDQNSDGLISLDEFLDVFKNQTILQENLILPCKDIFQKHLVDIHAEKSNYNELEHRDSSFHYHNIAADMWKIAGISDAASLLSHLGYSTSDINLNDLAVTLCDELRSLNESVINIDIQPHISLLKGVIALYKEELRNLSVIIENITGERDKLRIDIAEANDRAHTLAQEIDEHHLRQEEIKQNLLKQIEQRHAEVTKDLSNQLNLERETSTATLKIKEQQLQVQQQENHQNKNKLLTALQDNHALETENESLRDQINKLKQSNSDLLVQIKMLAAEHDEAEDTEVKKEEEVMHLMNRVKQLQSEIVLLRDQNDELTVELEIQRSRQRDFTEARQTNMLPNSTQTSLESDEDEGKHSLEDTIPTSNEKSSFQTALPHDKVKTYNGIDEKDNFNGSHIKDFQKGIIKDLKSILIRCVDCPCKNCDYKEEISSIINELQLKFNYCISIEQVEFSKSLASELETEYEERTSESLRDFVVPKSNKSMAVKRISNNSTETVDSSFVDTDTKVPENKMGSLRDYPPRKEEHIVTDHSKNVKEKESLSNHNTSLNEIEMKNSMNNVNGNDSVTTEQENWYLIEKKQLTERCMELERSLDLLKAEYEECEDYWAGKLEEERQLFEQEQKISDDKFSELITKIAEYEEMISPVDKVKNGGRLSPIEEKFNLEQQYLDLEEEFEKWKIQAQKDILEKEKEIEDLHEKLKSVKKFEKMDFSVQIPEEVNIQQPFNIPLSMQLESKMSQNNENSSIISVDYKADNVLDNSVPSSCFISQVIEEENSLEDYRINEIGHSTWIEANETVEAPKKTNIASESMLIERESNKYKLKNSTLKKEKNIFMQDATKPQSLKGLHCRCLQNCTQQVCTIDMSVLENLSMKLQIQERKRRQLQEYFRQRQHHIEQVLYQTLSQHQIEVSELRYLLNDTQEKLHLQIQANAAQAKRLEGADILAKDLFIENAYLIANLKRLEHYRLMSGINYESTSI